MININLTEDILKGLDKMGFEKLTPIQEEVIPSFFENKDIIGQAPTGTGKTCAFGIPIIDRIDVNDKSVQALVVCPTRELAKQIVEELRKVAFYKEGLKILAVYGGEYFERQLVGVRKKPQIIVGTPGRIIDHLKRKTIKLRDVKTIVLDEADEMLNMGFREDMEKIFSYAKNEHQTVMFSATMPRQIIEISERFQNEPVKIKTQLNNNDLPKIDQYYAFVNESQKFFVMNEIIKEKGYGYIIVFVSMKKRADLLAKILKSKGYLCECLHGDLRQNKREQIMKAFKKREFQVLIATDVVARGIDVTGIQAIFNYDVPYDREYYIHRIGRTARNNNTGVAYTFVTSGERNKIGELERYTKTHMTKLEDLSQDNLRSIMTDKKIENALSKINGNLSQSKINIQKQLDDYNYSNNTNYTYLDIAAAMLESDVMGVDMPRSKESTRMDRHADRHAKSENTKRFFINIGTRDRADKKTIVDYLKKTLDIAPVDVVDVHLLDNFGFIEVTNENEAKMMSLIGKDFSGREINIELAGEKRSGGRGRDSRNSSRGGRSYSRDGRGSRDSRPSYGRDRGSRDSRSSYGSRDSRSSRDRSYSRDDRDSRGSRGSRDRSFSRDDRDSRPSRERSDSRDRRDSRSDGRNYRGSSDNYRGRRN